MKRSLWLSEKIYLAGLFLILLFMLFHDWVSLGPLNNLEGIRAENTTEKLIQVTIINTVSILIVLALSLLYVGKRYPIFVRIWLIAHLGGILYGALAAWWIPYLTGTDQEMVERYGAMFGDTHTFLPVWNGIVPNTVHVIFHSILLMCWLLAIYLGWENIKRRKHSSRPGFSHNIT